MHLPCLRQPVSLCPPLVEAGHHLLRGGTKQVMFKQVMFDIAHLLKLYKLVGDIYQHNSGV